MTERDEDAPNAGAGTTRRNVLLSAGAVGAVGALGALAACGGDDKPSGGTGDDTANQVIKTGDIPVGSGKVIKAKNVVVTQPESGTFKAFDATCRHQGCQVATVTSTINCQCHGSRYSITDGSVLNGPSTQPLVTKTATVSGDTITVA